MESPSGRYFEVWGEAIVSARNLQRLLFFSILTNALLMLALVVSVKKPPLVIRVDKIGEAVPIAKYETTHEITKEEVVGFTRLFLEAFTKRNGYTIREDLEKAAAMMTAEWREKQENTSAISQAEAEKTKTTLTLNEVSLDKSTKETLVVSVKGFRAITSYENPVVSREEVFQGELVIKRVPRTKEAPWGLLADTYTESLYKK